jgi:hypothetical protein
MAPPPLFDYFMDVAAVVETDADGDGYGDDTQDLCPTNASTHGPCLQTKVKHAPRTVRTATGQAKVTLNLHSSVHGATFQCAVDGKAFKTCKSRFTKHYKVGKHVVLVRAVGADGGTDLTPTKVKFKVEHVR